MVALKNGVVQNKAGHPFDRSTGTWKNQNVAENPNVVQENVSNSDGENTSTNKKPDATTENSNSAETQQTDTKKAQTDTAKEKPTAETKETPVKPPKPRVIEYNIDGKKIYISSKDWQHFNELRAQLASGIPLDDDLITKMKPILAEAHLRDGTKIFNNEAQLDDIMKHYRGKQISSFDDLLEFVLRKIR